MDDEPRSLSTRTLTVTIAARLRTMPRVSHMDGSRPVFPVVQREETMPAGDGIERLGDFLQDPQGHQPPDTPLANLPGDLTRHRSFSFFFFFHTSTCYFFHPISGIDLRYTCCFQGFNGSWNQGRKGIGDQL